jgi:hypothetical protein
MASKRQKALRTNPAEAHWLLGEESRWKIVRALLGGQSMTIREFATLACRGRDAISKHVHLMVAHGLLQRTEKRSGDRRKEYFELVPDWRVEGEPMTLDFGHCQVRFGAREHPVKVEPAVKAPAASPTRGILPKRI